MSKQFGIKICVIEHQNLSNGETMNFAKKFFTVIMTQTYAYASVIDNKKKQNSLCLLLSYITI